jgi:hypothetical protein
MDLVSVFCRCLPSLLTLVIFEIRSVCMSRLSWTTILFVLPRIGGMAGMYYCAQPLVEMGVSWTFWLELAWTWSLLTSASQVARSIGLSHCAQFQHIYFLKKLNSCVRYWFKSFTYIKHLIAWETLWDLVSFTDEEDEAQRGKGDCSTPHSYYKVQAIFGSSGQWPLLYIASQAF